MMKVWVLVAFLLQSSSVPIRLGDLAKSLKVQDVMELEKIAAAGGQTTSPWLLEGPVAPSANSIRLYVAPKTQTRELRRGPAIELARTPCQTNWVPVKTVE